MLRTISKRFFQVVLSGVLLLAVFLPQADSEDLERSVCGYFTEPVGFFIFRSIAGFPNPDNVKAVQHVMEIHHKTKDGRVLRGYRLFHPNRKAASLRGYLLVAQGIAMLADHLLDDLVFFRDQGFDVYIFDYRGYGLSEGSSRLVAMISDYREIVSSLNDRKRGYRGRYLYGISYGGILLLNAVSKFVNYDRIVIDGTPGALEKYGCPSEYDPVRHIPKMDASRLKIISGLKDSVVGPEEMKNLIEVVKKRGGQALVHPRFGHPFKRYNSELRRDRLCEVLEFISKLRCK